MVRMHPTDRRRTRLARLAWACAVLVLLITSLSAFIRLSRAGLGCEPWPQCVSGALAAGGPGATEAAPGVTQARITHRVVASAALLIVIVLLVQCHTGTPGLPRQGRLAAALLALGVFLAILGRMAGDSRAAPVVMANLLAGFAMFALACRLALSLRPGAGVGARAQPTLAARRLAWVALGLLALQVALGGVLGAAAGPTACEGAWACGVHRLSGLATALVLVATGVLAWRTGGVAARAVVALAAAQAVLGLTVAEGASPLALAVAHNLLAALLGGALLALVPARAG